MRASVVASVLAHAEADPEHVALITEQGTKTTYGALVELARVWATSLTPRTRIAMCPRSDPHSIAAVLGAWLAESSVVLMHHHLTSTQTVEVIANAGAEVEVTETMNINARSDGSATMPAGELLVGLTSGTSGTSGKPKLFSRDHASWIATFQRSDQLVDIVPEDVVAVPGAVDHSHFLYGLIHALNRGATVDLRDTTAAGWPHINVLYSVPTIATDLLSRGESLEQLRTVLSSGASWQPSARESFKRLLPPTTRIYDFYGAGELSFVSVDDGRGPAGCLGRPFSGVEVQIRKPDGNLAEVGQSGVIEVSSDMVFSGYLRPDGVVEPPHTPWITVGDRGYFDQGGWLFLTGRQSRMFTRGGLNVEPEAIERALSRHPGVQAAACVAQRSERWGSLPVAFATTSERVGVNELGRWCAEHLDVVHRPYRIHVLDQMPTTHRGKIDYRRLEALTEPRA